MANLLSGMRPTGKLHLGHLSVLQNWASLQDQYQCYYFIADWHALTTSFDDTSHIKQNVREIVLDYVSAGLDPEKSVLFVQSDVKEHAELHLLLSMITPLSWLERVPTYKEQIRQLGEQGKDINSYGFLGYPLLMSSDILLYRPYGVPVGEDQLPHIEFTREIARRFNNLFSCKVFPEPQGVMAKITCLPGTDNRKMSKSYNNFIEMSASPERVWEKVQQMITDPERIRKTDPGHPEICAVYKYHTYYNGGEAEDICASCKKGEIGCVACKKRLAAVLNEYLAPIIARRHELEKNPARIEEILHCGANKARVQAAETLALVREAMKI